MGLAVNDVISIIYQSEWVEQRILLTLTYKVTTTTSTQTVPTDLQKIADFFAAAGAGLIRSVYQSVTPTNLFIRLVRAQRIYPNRSVYKTSLISGTGSWASDATTGNLAAIVTMRTDLGGRKQVANKHIGPVPADAVVDGSVTAGYKAALDLMGAEMKQGQTPTIVVGEAIALDPIIYHKGFGSFDLITSWLTSERVGTMRRRTLRVGE